MEASQCYPNTIQQAIAHTYIGCPYVYGIGNCPIHIRDFPYAYGTSHTCMGEYTHAGQNSNSKYI